MEQVTDYAELSLADDTSIRLRLSPTGERSSGSGGTTPVGRVGDGAARLTTGSLRAVLRPLGPLLQQVHDAVRTAPNPPQEITVEFGVQVGQDLKLGIVSGQGQANLSISASWHLPRDIPHGAPDATAGPHAG